MTYISLVYFYKSFHMSLNTLEYCLTFLSIAVINITTKNNLRRRSIHVTAFWSQSIREGRAGTQGSSGGWGGLSKN